MSRAASLSLVAVVLLAGLFGAGTPVSGQLSIGVAGGPSTPVGGLADVVNAGVHAGVVADLGLPLLPLAVRGEVMFQRLPGAGDRAAFDQVWGAANGRFDLLPIPLVGAYVTAGLGLYSSRFDATQGTETDRATHVGFNAGIGGELNLLVVRSFIEARYHRVGADPARAFIPITVGVFF